jgi:SAM-dependent methyltransferase
MTPSEIFWEIRRHFFKSSYPRRVAQWPLRLPGDMSLADVQALKDKVDQLDARSQYGWGQTIDFGAFKKQGFLDIQFLEIAGLFDAWGWWPRDLTGRHVADIGCFTGGHTVLIAHRGAEKVYSIDEIPVHLEQCALLCDAFGISGVQHIESSLYGLSRKIPTGSLDLALLSGVLYHLSDMLVGLLEIRELLKPGGRLLIETNALDDKKRSFANFGRYYGGMWWQPSARCIRDLCEYTGFDGVELRFYKPDRCLVCANRGAEAAIPFKRGMNWPFASLDDAEPRTMNRRVMAPVRPRLW